MRIHTSRSAWLTLAAVILLANPAIAAETASPAKVAPNEWVLYFIMGIAVLAVLFASLNVLNSLTKAKWSLSDALSEESEVTLLDPNGVPIPSASGEPQKITKLVASSSRLIAMLGLIGILVLFMAQGLILLWDTAHHQDITNQAGQYAKYLMYGAVMFAPYVVNKFSSIFETFGPR